MFKYTCLFNVRGERRGRLRKIAKACAAMDRWRDYRIRFRGQSSFEFMDPGDFERFLAYAYLFEGDLVTAQVK